MPSPLPLAAVSIHSLSVELPLLVSVVTLRPVHVFLEVLVGAAQRRPPLSRLHDALMHHLSVGWHDRRAHLIFLVFA